MAKPRSNIEPEHMEWLENYLKEHKWLIEGIRIEEHIKELSSQRWRTTRIAYHQRLKAIRIQEQLKELGELKSRAKSTYTKHN